MERAKDVQPLVYNALLNFPETRKDDFLLVLEVYKTIINPDMRFDLVFTHHKALGLPSFASIIRIRRKLQREFPDLVNTDTAEMRAEAEKEYRDYAKTI